MSHDNALIFRIGLINDFQGVKTFVDYRRFGIVTSVDACEIKYKKERLDNSSGIYIFFNYEKIGFFKKKEEARKFILNMLDESPKEVNKEYDIFANYLLRSLE